MSDTEFEIYVYNTLKARFPQNEGWQVSKQPTLPSTAKPDFLVRGSGSLVVVDAKDKERLERSDVDSVLGYVAELTARIGIIYTANDTEITDSVTEYAKAKGIEVTRTQWWQD